MIYSSKLLQDGRYGIFINNELSATTSCLEECKKLMQALKERIEQK